MATYEELFPDQPQDPFVPIETGRVNPQVNAARGRARTALNFSGADTGFNDAFGDLLQAPSAPPSGGEVSAGDYGRAAIGGLGQLGQAAAGAGEYLASQVAGKRNTPFEQAFGDLADTFAGGRRAAGEFAQDWFSSMSPEAQARAAREVLTLDPNKTIWQGGPGEFLSSVGLKMAQSAPSTLVTLLPGALIMRAGMGAGAIAYLGASEGGLSLGSIAANIAEEIEKAPEAELMQSERYKQLRQQMDDAGARQALIREAQGYAPVIGGLVVGAISAASGRFLEPVFADKAGGLAARFGRGFVSEAAQESGQSGAEQVAQNVAAQTFDARRGTFEGVPEQMGQGALVGGAMGGGTLAAVGPRPQPRTTAIPTGESLPTAEPAAAQAAPESFQQVFRQQTPLPGGWRGGDIETGTLPDIDSTGQRLIDVGPVDPALQAALNARAENLITDMFEPQGPTPQQEQQAYLQNPWPVQQTEMELPQAQTGMVPSGPPSQLPLGIRERVQGGPPVTVTPTPAENLQAEDLSAPPGFSQERLPTGDIVAGRRPTRADFMRARAEQERAGRYQGTVLDPRQQDMFGEQTQMADEPSAEPISDLNAQLQDLADPDSARLGVYLSPANMQQVGEIPTIGVPLANFDGKGGTLIAKNRRVAEELLSMRDQGAADMQELLGLATGAGGGKPVGADIAVQQRDAQGNVVRESLVATPEEADTLATQFDEPGREGVILSAGMAIKRRAQRIAAEQQAQRGQRIERQAVRRIGETAESVGAPVESEETAKRIGVRYQSLKEQLARAEKAQSDAPTRAERLKARETGRRIQAAMDTLREDAEATVRSVRKPKHFQDTRKSLEELTDEQIDKLPDEQLEELFLESAGVASGSRMKRSSTKDESREVAEAGATTTFSPHGKTLEEIIAAHPSRSQKLKLVSRVKRTLRRRAMGGRTKTAPITGKASLRKGVAGGEPTPVRRSELRPTKALDLEPPRELASQERAKHNARVRKTYKALDTRMQAFMAQAEKLNTQLAQQSEAREANGNPPQAARDAIYGRAYLNTLLRYGQMLQALRPRSTSGLKEVERYNALVTDLLDSKPEKFLSKLARATEAEADVQAKAAVRMDPTVLKGLSSRRQRRALAMDAAANLREKIARAKRLHDVWHKNVKFDQHVAPLMQKLIGYVTHDTSLANIASERRGLGYLPTFAEMRNLRSALVSFKQEDREQLYKPLKRWFEEYGYKFDQHGDLVLAKSAAQYEYVRPERLLENDRSAFRNAPLNYAQKVQAQKAKRLKARLDTERARRAALTPAQRRREDLTLANRIEAVRRKGMSYEQRKALEALDRRGLNLELMDVSNDMASLRRAAEAIGNTLENADMAATGESILRKLAASLPPDHAYQPLVQRLLNLNMDNLYVLWDDGNLTSDAFANYREQRDQSGIVDRVIRFNRPRFETMRAEGKDPSQFFVHAMLHEMTHAATAGAIANNPRVKAAMWAIMRQARIAAGQQNISLLLGNREHYGFRDNSVDEFVAEAFSNQTFQNKLREIKIAPNRTVWQAILDLVKRLLGLEDAPRAENVLDAVLATTDKLFTGEMQLTRGAESVLAIKDNSAAQAVGNVVDKIMQSSRVTRELRERAKDTIESNKEGGSRFLLSALTMEQIRDFYANAFGGGRGPLSEYMKAFFNRNAANSANMEQADKLSRRWTALTEQLGQEQSVELSRVMTEGTLYGIHPNEPLQAKANEHVKSIQQRQRHADLSRRFKALPPELRALYSDLRTYYAETFRREVNLVTLNSLRAVVEGKFDYTEEDIERKKLNTIDGLKKEFGDRLNESDRQIIARTAGLPLEQEGPYFPLMRFGDYVVTAERVKETKHFADRESARKWAREQMESDPTLSVSPPQEDDTGFTVTVKEKEVRMAESPSEAKQNRQDMIAEYGVENVDREVQKKSKLYARDSAISSGSGLRSILGKLDGNPAAQAAIKDFYLRSISDKAFRKREIKRAHRRGVDFDTQHRTFASYAKSAAYFMSQLEYGSKMADALIAMDKYAKAVAKGKEQSNLSVVRMNDVIDEINTRDKLTHDPLEVSKLVRGGTELSQFMMLTSPSYWMINATQPYMVTLPWLAARSSIGEATAALTTAQRLILSPIVNQMGESFGGLKALWSKTSAEKAFTVLEQVEDYIKQRGGARATEYIDMLNKLKRDSIIDLSFVAELRDIAEGQNTSVTQRVLDASRIMSHLTEVNNRIMTAIAAYDLYRNKGATIFQSSEFAKQAVSLTQFNYSSGNAPRLFQARGPLGQMGPLIFQFMKYPQHMYALLIDNFRRAVWSGGMDRKVALKTLAGLFTTHLAVGGVMGAMLQPIKWAIGLTMAAFGDDDEPYTVKNALSGETFDRMLREATTALFGNEFGEIVSAGLPRAAGIDLSNRMSLGTLYFIDLKTDTAESTLGSIVSSFGGPLVNLGLGWWKGAQYMSEGQVSKGLEAFMPKAAKDVAKMIRYTSEGLTDATGKEILGADKMSPWQLFAQSIGFQPAQVSESYARRAAIKDSQSYDAQRRQTLLRRFQNADASERGYIISEIAEFNRNNPAAGISRSQLLKSVQSFKERAARTSNFGVDLRGDDVLYAEEGEAYNE